MDFNAEAELYNGAIDQGEYYKMLSRSTKKQMSWLCGMGAVYNKKEYLFIFE